jgi:LysM repeat protein
VYYTLDVGSVGGSGSNSSGSGNTVTTAAPNAPAPATALAFYPVVLATANPDGSIVHVVQPGQALWNIAASYKISLPDLMTLNGFTENSFIYPGDKILIQLANPNARPAMSAATGSPEASPSGAPGGSATPAQAETPDPGLPNAPSPSPSIQPSFAASPSAQPESSASRSAPKPASGLQDPLIWFIAGLVFVGTALLILGNVLNRGG